MADIKSIATALAALKRASDILETLSTSKRSHTRIDFELNIARLIVAVNDAHIAVFEIKREIHILDGRIARAKHEARAQMVIRNKVYYLRENERKRGPFCPHCFDVDGINVTVTPLPESFAAVAKFMCPKCTATY